MRVTELVGTASAALLALALGLPAASAEPTVFKVGPAGTHARIQDAVDAAASLAGDVEIHVACGRFDENVLVGVNDGRMLHISGGWSADFTGRAGRELFNPAFDPGDPLLNTVVHGKTAGPVLHGFSAVDGSLILEGLTLTGGGGSDGPAVFLWTKHDGVVELLDNAVWRNHASVEAGGFGFLSAISDDRSRMVVRGNLFAENSSQATMPGAWANGGADVFAVGHSLVLVESNRFLRNEVRAPRQANVSGLAAEAQQDARVEVNDNWFFENRSVSAASEGMGVSRFAAEVQPPGSPGAPRLIARRNFFLRNEPAAWYLAQLDVRTTGNGIAVVSDSVVAGGPGGTGGGITTSLDEGGAAFLTNLTVTGVRATGVLAFGTGAQLHNSILYHNGVNRTGAFEESHNLEDDPLFVDAASDDYRLLPGSSAIDAGSNVAPEMGPWDVYQERRVKGRAVDIGAAESPDGSSDEVPCAVLSPTARVGSSAPICRCVSDTGLRVARCGVLDLPDLVLALHFPLGFDPEKPVGADWTIDPRPGVDGPFQMSAAARVGDQWVGQQWLPDGPPVLTGGKPASSSFAWELPGGQRTYLRTRLEYTRQGKTKPEPLEVEVLLPKR